ncbi:hydroxymethylpyrimidine/phosphomethylpyrimidine kinase [Streptococcus penaeicida]|uniref:Hydroxymethylpyrimidine/phosphomethylpyrimidine kinase n=1 Tax=Streptococcus penaeicida TaxID=1765960 RepID=A0A2N8LC86_9STRE|nr:bifunctional hydroxymethylpyrimidine kinase/phosphomethylpyrimidine kinase [Streptococcus penaeicida]PND47770.1 hydroxymethylpyrimidine/phosphomethylpyrimidine kinase [Streptococcus penaeicida]
MTQLHTVLTIAGTDPSGGAGVMADLKSFQARNVYGMAVITSLVAQNTCGVRAVENVSVDFIKQELDCVFEDIPPQAIKSGMLASLEIIDLVADYLQDHQDIPYVLDPVMVATRGHRLINEDAIEALRQKLLPLATVITPNLMEAEVIIDRPLTDEVSIIRAGRDIQSLYQVKNVIIKGGHLEGEAIDYLFLEDGSIKMLSSQRVDTKHTHGTGCTFAAVIAAELAKGKSVSQAFSTAKAFITKAIETAPELGKGNGPVNHTTYKGE